VVTIDPPRHVLVVAHEPVPGYMGAMTMPFLVHDTIDLSAIKPGDHIDAAVVVRPDSVWLEDIVIQRPEPRTP
jgi:Cu/Ag efflux protein CusF